jgi:hypothetical protein
MHKDESVTESNQLAETEPYNANSSPGKLAKSEDYEDYDDETVKDAGKQIELEIE